MTPRPDWHPDEQVLQAYVDGAAPSVLADSLEAHVLTCATCRAALASAVDPGRVAVVRVALEDRLDEVTRPLTERLARRLGLGEADARVLCAAPSMRRAWWAAVALALVLAVAAAQSDPDRADLLLLLAPLVPVLATALSYAPRLDPALPTVAATPYPAMRLLLLRSGAVAGASTVLAALASAALPIGLEAALVWLLPACALTAAVLALSSWVDPATAAGVCGAAWLTAVGAAVRADHDALAVFGPPGQVTSALVLAVAAAVLVQHRHRLDPGSPS